MSRRQVDLFRKVLILVDTLITLVAFVVAFYLRQWIAMQAGPLLSALDPGSLATAWATVSVLGLLASLLAGALLGRC